MAIIFTRFIRQANFIRITAMLTLLAFCSVISETCLAQNLPLPDHIVILIEENQPSHDIFGLQVIGNSVAPYITALVADTDAANFTAMSAITHPSQPNYLDFFAGDNQGVTTDNLHTGYPWVTDNMAAELRDKGLTFVTYSQGLPFVGSDTVSAGSYVRKHNPVTNWVGTGTNQVPATMNQPFTAFPTDFTQLPTVCYIVPNEDSDMHNGTGNAAIGAGDYWMKEHMDSLIHWARNHNTLFIYTFDEDDGFGSNIIPTVFFGPMVKGGPDTTAFNRYNILRTIEDIYGLRYAGAAASSLPITNCWKSLTTGFAAIETPGTLKVYPNPASSIVNFDGTQLDNSGTEISITDITGRLISHYTLPDSKRLEVNTSSYPAGMYFYYCTQNNIIRQSGKFSIAR